MFSSLIIINNIILTLYQDDRTVFGLKDIALTGETNFENLSNRLNYDVRTGKLENPPKGNIYKT